MQFIPNGVDKLCCALCNRGTDCVILIASAFKIFTESFKLLVGCKVDLVRRNNLGTLCKLGVEFFKLFVDNFKILNGVSAFAACGIDDMHEKSAAVNVAEEFVAETHAVACTLDKSGDIRHNERTAFTH